MPIVPVLLDAFLAKAVETQVGWHHDVDSFGLKMMSGGEPASEGVPVLCRWLGRYGIARRVPVNRRAHLAHLIDFVRQLPALPDNEEACLTELIRQHGKLTANLAAWRNASERSAASKLLWLRHPHDVPMFDRFDSVSLSVIANARGVCGDDYDAYARLVRAIYREHRPRIDDASRSAGYDYPIRVLDQVLSHAGRPRFALKAGG